MKFALLSFVSIIFLLIGNAIIISTYHSDEFTISDFRAQYTGAGLAIRDRYDLLYDLQTQYAAQKKLFPKLTYVQALPFFSPPLIAALLSPLALLEFRYAYLFFCLILTTVMILTSLLLMQKLTISAKARQLFKLHSFDILLILVSFFPFWLNILNAQLSLLWILIFFSAYLYLRQKKYMAAGLIVSLLSLKIHLLFVPLIFFIVIKNLPVIKGILIGICSLFIFQILFFGLDTLQRYFTLLYSLNFNSDKFSLNPSQQISLKGTLYWFLQDRINQEGIFYLWLTAVTIIIFLSCRFWSKCRKIKISQLKLLWSSVIIITLLTSPHTHYHDYAILIIPILLIIHYAANDYLLKGKKDNEQITYPLIKYGVVLTLIILSALISSIPPVSLLLYLLLIYLVFRFMVTGPGVEPRSRRL